jgi:hypothetical protein
MARCAAAKLLPFAALLLGAGDETSGDDEALVDRATDSGPCGERRAQPAPPVATPWTGFGSGAPDENIRRAE